MNFRRRILRNSTALCVVAKLSLIYITWPVYVLYTCKPTETFTVHNWNLRSVSLKCTYSVGPALSPQALTSIQDNGNGCRRKKFLKGRRLVRNLTSRTISSLFLCRKLHLFLGKSTKNLCHQSCTFWFQYAPKSIVGWGFAPDPTGGAYSAPPAVFWGPTSKGRRGKGERGKEKRKERECEGREEGSSSFALGRKKKSRRLWLCLALNAASAKKTTWVIFSQADPTIPTVRRRYFDPVHGRRYRVCFRVEATWCSPWKTRSPVSYTHLTLPTTPYV